MKKAVIVSPYLAHLGGGERYMLEAARVIESCGYELYFAWDNLAQINSLCQQLGISLTSPQIDKNILPYYFGNTFKMYQATRNYDLVFYMSDGSIPLLGGVNNILHMQIPYHDVGGRGLWTQLKLKRISKVVVNSSFTKKFVDHEYKLNSALVYPPYTPIKPGKKQKIILSVGRFDKSKNIKKQDLLIEAFRLLSSQIPGWKLVLAGGSSDPEWEQELIKQAQGLPIEFYFNITYDKLCQLYAKSFIYWHAAGYGVDEKKHPELVEHFGISTVEAISAGCIPLVVGKGGQIEIVKDSHYHWEVVQELIDKTLHFIKDKPVPRIDLSRFDISRFENSIKDLVT